MSGATNCETLETFRNSPLNSHSVDQAAIEKVVGEHTRAPSRERAKLLPWNPRTTLKDFCCYHQVLRVSGSFFVSINMCDRKVIWIKGERLNLCVYVYMCIFANAFVCSCVRVFGCVYLFAGVCVRVFTGIGCTGVWVYGYVSLCACVCACVWHGRSSF